MGEEERKEGTERGGGGGTLYPCPSAKFLCGRIGEMP